MTLTPKQQRFVAEYRKNANATEAYIAAGYSSNGARGHGARMVANGNIQAELKRLSAESDKRMEVEDDYIRAHLLAIIGQGTGDDAPPPNYTDVLKALDQLAKIDGKYLKDNEQSQTPVHFNLNYT